MFQALRQNSQIYIFHKGNKPILEIGQVTNIPVTRPKYSVTQTFGPSQELVVDLSVKVGERIVNYNSLPAQSDIADSYSNGENIVIYDSREAINSEIITFKQKSIDTINSIDIHKEIITECEQILNRLNPEYAEKKQQQDEISTLKNQMSQMSESLTSLTKYLEQLTRKESKNEQTVGNS